MYVNFSPCQRYSDCFASAKRNEYSDGFENVRMVVICASVVLKTLTFRDLSDTLKMRIAL